MSIFRPEVLKTLAVVIVAAGLAVAVTLAVGKNRALKLGIKTPGGTVSLEVDGDSAVDHEKLLTALFNSGFAQPSVVAWLKSKQALVRYKDADLARTLNESSCEAFPVDAPKNFEARKKCAQQPGVKELRLLAHDRLAPFHDEGYLTNVSVPNKKDIPSEGYMAVCNRDWIDRKLQLTNPARPVTIFVEGRGLIPTCSATSDADHSTQAHITPEAAKTLFGTDRQGVNTIQVIPLN